MEDKVIEIIERISGVKDLKQNKDIDLVSSGILDSLGFIELVYALDEEFDIEIYPTQVAPEVWKSIEKIVELVKSLI